MYIHLVNSRIHDCVQSEEYELADLYKRIKIELINFAIEPWCTLVIFIENNIYENNKSKRVSNPPSYNGWYQNEEDWLFSINKSGN